MTQLLKERRIELGKEIAEAAETTRIKGSYLKAIEEEDFSKLPIEVYTKGYIREYAKYLGVYSEDIIASYDSYLDEKKGIKGKSASVAAAKEKSLNIEIANEQTEQKGLLQDSIADTTTPLITGIKEKPYSKRALLVLPLLAIIIAIYFLLPQSEKAPEMPLKLPAPVQEAPQTPHTPQINAVQQDTQSVPQIPTQVPAVNEVDKTKAVKADVKPEIKADAKLKNETAAGQKKKYSLDIKATDKVWLQIVIDGSEKKEMTLNVGDRIVYGANESFNILVGNAAGVDLKYNDRNFGALGEKGQVVRLNLPEMTSPQVVTIKKKETEGISSESKSNPSNPMNQ